MRKEKEEKRKKIHFNFFSNFFRRKKTNAFDTFIEQLKSLNKYDFEYTYTNEDDTKIIKVKNKK